MTADIIDRIYECSLMPENWSGVLHDLAHMAGGRGGVLFTVKDRGLNWTASPALDDVFKAYVDDGWFDRCTRRVCLFSKTQPVFLVEHDFWTSDELNDNPIYRDFFRPRGLGWSAGTGLPLPTGDNIVFSFERAFDLGPVEQSKVSFLNDLRPHLARSAFVAARLGLQNARGANSVLTTMGLPALVFDEVGMVVEANSLIEEMHENVRWRSMNRVTFSDTLANQFLQDCLTTVESDDSKAIRSFPIRDTAGNAAYVAHIVPMKRTARDIFTRSYALLIITPVRSRRMPPVELLRSLFDLTPSEARVARSLASGETLDEIAVSGGVGKNTIRSQVRQVLEKTGCSRQAEVVALLNNISIPVTPESK